ncbi:MAG: hypothetical protein NW220_01740 [Leptolyngbyaceae cyanobacterium bins.349]|nr:hypothetical protein [Leptolyngbyaceae cyanobacterium bins.349]
MSSESTRKDAAQKPVSGAEALGGPVELKRPTKPIVPGLNLDRLKQVEKEINDKIKRDRPTPKPHRIEIDL